MTDVAELENPEVVVDNPKRTILEELFGEIHEFADVDFSCAFQSRASLLLHGRLYVTDTFLGFYTNLFGIEKKIKIPLKTVKSVTPAKTMLVIPNAISVETDERTYIFRSFLQRDRALAVIETYIGKFKAEEERQARKREKVLKNAMKSSVKSSRESLNHITESSRETFSHLAEASRSARSSFFAGITSVFKGPSTPASPGTDTEDMSPSQAKSPNK